MPLIVTLKNMKIWIYLLLLTVIPITSLTGCISKQPAPIELPNIELNEDNSVEHKDPKGKFTLRLPEEFDFVPDQETDTARLFRINKAGSAETVMFFEENFASLESSVQLMVDLEEITEVSREAIEINGLQGIKLNVELSTNPGQVSPYYFLHDGEKFSYIFSLLTGNPFDHYLGLINSFELIN